MSRLSSFLVMDGFPRGFGHHATRMRPHRDDGICRAELKLNMAASRRDIGAGSTHLPRLVGHPNMRFPQGQTPFIPKDDT
jgi:hypothetical protein